MEEKEGEGDPRRPVPGLLTLPASLLQPREPPPTMPTRAGAAHAASQRLGFRAASLQERRTRRQGRNDCVFPGYKAGLWRSPASPAVSRPAGPHRHWPPTLGSRAVGDSCRHPVALVGGGLGRCWQWEPGGEGPGPSRGPEACPQGPGCPPEGPCRLFCPCPPACTPGPAGPRRVAQRIPLLAHGLGHRGTHPQPPRGCLCP